MAVSIFIRRFVQGLFPALVVAAAMLLMQQSVASAQPCGPGPCTDITIFNCSNPGTMYVVEFELCCGGMQSISLPITVPPVPCGEVSAVYTAPPGCTINNVWSISPPLPPYNFGPCFLVLY